MIILQKVKFSFEKQTSWDRLVSLPESPFASLLLQCKEKAKTCNVRSTRLCFDKPMGISDYLIYILTQARGSRFVVCFFFFSILAFSRLLKQGVQHQSPEEGNCGQDRFCR